jgi:hypothetical protein
MLPYTSDPCPWSHAIPVLDMMASWLRRPRADPQLGASTASHARHNSAKSGGRGTGRVRSSNIYPAQPAQVRHSCACTGYVCTVIHGTGLAAKQQQTLSTLPALTDLVATGPRAPAHVCSVEVFAKSYWAHIQVFVEPGGLIRFRRTYYTLIVVQSVQRFHLCLQTGLQPCA